MLRLLMFAPYPGCWPFCSTKQLTQTILIPASTPLPAHPPTYRPKPRGQALQRPEQLGKLAERRDVRYNAACALCLAGQHDQALVLLQQLAAAQQAAARDCGGGGNGGWLVASEVAADEDLAGLREKPAFQELLHVLAAQQQQQ